MQIKTYLHIYRVSPCRNSFRFIQGTVLCPVMYVCTIRLYPLSTLLWFIYLSIYISFCFCINYANERYLHRGRVSFRKKSVIIIRHAHANLKIDKKNTAVMCYTFFKNLQLYALMSNLCKLDIYLPNKLIYFVMIHFSTSNFCTKFDINLDLILFIFLHKLSKICIWM